MTVAVESVVRDMNETEARALTERIKAQAEQLWRLLLEAHERKAWTALGYETWAAYIYGEFERERDWGYRLVRQGQVIRAIEEATGVLGSIQISTEAAQAIKPSLPALTAEIRERVAAGEDPEEAVQETVAAARAKKNPTPKPGLIVTRGNSPVVAIQKAMDTLDAMRVMFRSIALDALPDDAPAEEWIREIDRSTKALRALRAEIRGKYGIA